MLSLSTAWYPQNDKRMAPTLEAIRGMGFSAVEIGVSGMRCRMKKLKKFLGRLDLGVTSVHNVCSERRAAPSNVRGDWLASTDAEQRKEGVAATLESARAADELGADVVVVHLGQTPIEEAWDKQETIYERRSIPDGWLAERRRHAEAQLDAASRSLEELLAQSDGVRFALESRMGWHELPSLVELGGLLERFPGPRIGYWHDVGHAVILEHMGCGDRHAWLERHGSRTFGAHLHDVAKNVRDHLPPGMGDVDFAALRPLLPREALCVMEISSRFIVEEVALGKARLEELGY
ncbi:sugar phosphate isomerase/epimerase [bacterium]|nr:sugar phosphate isomerase/epimerase [bacterium]